MGTATGTSFHIEDIGGATVVIDDGSPTPGDKKYLYYNGTNIYDIGYDNFTNVGTDLAEKSKWCMEPANKTGLYIQTHSGGEEEVLTDLWYYSSYCVPFDMLIANKNDDPEHSSNAYTCVSGESDWDGVMLHPKPIGKYNTGTYHDNDYFVPAGTPVLFSTKRASSYIKATIPTTTPSTSISTIFSYQYLEQKLNDTWANNKRVFVFGPKMEGTFEITSDGTITATLPSLGNTNVGFHINANQNKEAGLTPATWTRNNYYVQHNKIYYKETGSSVKRLGALNDVNFIPVVFDDEEEMDEPTNVVSTIETSGDVYDLSGRKVATEQQVNDGTWRQILRPGIYIVGGKKIKI